MSSAVVKSVGSVVALVLSGLAASNAFPALTPVFSAVAGLLGGWLHLPQPQSKKEQA
jgi:hypothetical protein